jgi:hypothetical protein
VASGEFRRFVRHFKILFEIRRVSRQDNFSPWRQSVTAVIFSDPAWRDRHQNMKRTQHCNELHLALE